LNEDKIMTTTQTVDNGKAEISNMFRQANENFRSAMETGIRFQQDAFRSISDVLGRSESLEDARNRMEMMATDSINLIRKNAEQSQKLFDETCRSGMDLLRRSFELMDPPGGKHKDVYGATREIWTAAFDTMRSNIEAASKTSAQAIENWSNFFSKSMSFAEKKPAAK